MLSGDSLVLGKTRDLAKIVAWSLPRTDDNDYRTRQVSRKQCVLKFDEFGV